MTTAPLVLEIGKRLSPNDAKSFTDEIKHRMYARWNEKIFGGTFMRDLEAGELPMETIRLFWKHWYSYQVEIKQGETFGVSLDAMVSCEVFPECRALTEFGRGLVYEGSMIEWWARSLNEEMFGHWSKRWRQALLDKYKFKDTDLHYFQVHEEA